jgi:DNA-binding winged helix-turn-helix (wHTH) protein
MGRIRPTNLHYGISAQFGRAKIVASGAACPWSAPEENLKSDIELDVAAYELLRRGGRVRLERQPMDLLILLVEGRGRLVSRDEIVRRLWAEDVSMDIDAAIHSAIRKLRRALGDKPVAPRFIEKRSRQGLSIHRRGQGGDRRARRHRRITPKSRVRRPWVRTTRAKTRH